MVHKRRVVTIRGAVPTRGSTVVGKYRTQKMKLGCNLRKMKSFAFGPFNVSCTGMALDSMMLLTCFSFSCV